MIQLQSGKVPLAGPKTERIHCALCPTMDLITFAGGGQAHVTTLRSIDWEKLFSSVCANCSGAMAWRPDGKEIAVGTSDGRIVLLKTETGLERDVDGSVQTTPEGDAESRISCLHWTVDRINRTLNSTEERKAHDPEDDSDAEDQDDDMFYEDTDDEDTAFASHSFLRVPKKLPQLTAAGKLKTEDDNEHPAGMEENRDANESFADGSRCEKALLKGSSLDVLVAGDAGGTVSCHAFGHFTIGAISLKSLSPGDQNLPTRITHVFMADNLEAMIAVAQISRADEGLHEYYLCTISTKILSTARPHIAAVASEFTFIRAELGRLQSALDQAVRFWEEGVLGSLRKLFAPLVDEEEAIREARGQTPNRRQMLDDVLFELFVKGVFGTSLVRYFTKHSEANIVKVCRVWDVACDALIKLLEHTCTPSVEGLIFRLGDLIGKSQADEGFRSIGVDPGLLTPFLKESEKLILAIQRVAQGVREAKQDLNSLERWLIGCHRRWPGGAVYHQGNQQGPIPFPNEDAKRVERMLFESDIEHRELSAQLGLKQRASNIVTGKKVVPSWDRAFTEDNVDDENMSGLFQAKVKSPQICDLVANLSAKWKGIMPSVRETMNKSFVLQSAKLLFSISTDEDTQDIIGRIALGSVQRDIIDVVFVGGDQRNQVTVLSCTTRADQLAWKTRLQPYTESEGEITHVAFCGSTPGRASTLEGSIFALTTSERHLKILGDTGTDQLTVLRDCQMEFRPSDAIANVSCSGPRGVACVLTLRRSFELYDIVHEEELEEETIE